MGGVIVGIFFEPVRHTDLPIDVSTEVPNQAVRLAVTFTLASGLPLMLILGMIGGLSAWISARLSSELMVEMIAKYVEMIAKYSEVANYLGLSESVQRSAQPSAWITAALSTGLMLGLLGGLIGGLLGGADIVIKHYLLRLALWLKGDIPRNYVRFLDYAAALIFLRKVGGGYIFVHRLVMEHVAGLSDADIQRIAGAVLIIKK